MFYTGVFWLLWVEQLAQPPRLHICLKVFEFSCQGIITRPKNFLPIKWH